MRTRSTLSPAVAAALAALALAGCGGGESGHGGPAAADSAPPTTLAPLPRVAPAEVKPLVGRWNGTHQDYFQFKADGSGVWIKDRQRLWSGQVIPESKVKFRFSWEGGDPKGASYWGAEVSADGTKMTFAGTNQVYTKAKA
ncbi:hypothetical protein [Spirillospora sp. NPDC047279]|uniref:hypothetical protein n=1 Tax=Spirillospora sp. NPDC047279 TaxID=3155478 RepID=UPI0033CC2F92